MLAASLLSEYFWYDKLLGPSQRVVTLFIKYYTLYCSMVLVPDYAATDVFVKNIHSRTFPPPGGSTLDIGYWISEYLGYL